MQYPARRHKPGRRPPNRFGYGRRRPQGFTPWGVRTGYRIMMTGLRGREKRLYFNKVSNYLVAGSAMSGAMAGFSLLGPLGAILGLGPDSWPGNRWPERGGSIAREYERPS